MSIFTKIKDAIFGHKSAPAQTQSAPTPQPTMSAASTGPEMRCAPGRRLFI